MNAHVGVGRFFMCAFVHMTPCMLTSLHVNDDVGRIHVTREAVEKALADDFDTPCALDAVLSLMGYLNQVMQYKTEVIAYFVNS